MTKLIETFTEEDRALIRRYRAGERTGHPAEAWKRYWQAGKARREETVSVCDVTTESEGSADE